MENFPLLLRSPLFLFLMRRWGGGTPPQKIQQFFSFCHGACYMLSSCISFFWGVAAHGILSAFISFLEMSLLMGPQKRAFCILQHISILSRGASVCPAAEPLTKKSPAAKCAFAAVWGGGPPPLLFALFVAPSVSSAPLLCSGVFKSHLCASPKLAQRTQTRDSPLSYHVS